MTYPTQVYAYILFLSPREDGGDWYEACIWRRQGPPACDRAFLKWQSWVMEWIKNWATGRTTRNAREVVRLPDRADITLTRLPKSPAN